jgi:hypothetical protein
VLLPFEAGGQGKIRLEVGGNTIDLVARSEEQTPIERGRKVLVIDIKEGEAIVVHAPETGASEPEAKGE